MPNSSLIHADIFFFISTIALVLISAAIIVVAVYLIRILRNVQEMTDKAKQEWEEILTDSRALRSNLRDEGMKWKHVATLIRTFFMRDKDMQASKPKVTVKKSIKHDKKISI